MEEPSHDKKLIRSHHDLDVYRESFDAAMLLFSHSKSFPKEETYSLTDQMRRSSRSVSANIAEAWRKRRYKAAFISKLSDAETEAAETQVWIEYAVKCGYLEAEKSREIYRQYDQIIGMIVRLINNASAWVLN